MREFMQVPEQVSGFILDPRKGWFSVIVPEKSTNLVTNPSFEIGTTGFTAVNATIARVTTKQARGIASLEITPQTGVNAGVYYGTVTTASNQPYSLSLDVYANPNDKIRVYFADTSGNQLGRYVDYKGKGRWERISVSFPETTGASRRLYIVRVARAATTPFYIDGVQCEALAYPTTYIDGDQQGFLVGQNAYIWNGFAHASTSTRIYNTASGGREISLKEMGLEVTGIVGLGLPTFNNVATPLSSGGSLYQRSIYNSRQFTLAGTIMGANLSQIQRLRKQLQDAITAGRLPIDQEIILRYHRIDCETGEETKTIDIPCIYESGLEGNIDNHNQDKVGLTFTQSQPFLFGENKAVDVGLNEVFTDTNYKLSLMYSENDADWEKLTISTSSAPFAKPVEDSAGNIYITNNGTIPLKIVNGQWVNLWNVGEVFNKIESIFISNDKLYISGVKNIGGDFGVGYIDIGVDGVINDFDVSAIPTGTHSAGRWISRITVSKNGIVYLFLANSNHTGVWKYAGGVWTELGTGSWTVSGSANIVYDIQLSPDETKLYVAGDFSLVYDVSAKGVAVYDILTGTWSGLGAGLELADNTTGGIGACLTFVGSLLYVGGSFVYADNTECNNIAVWNGSFFYAVGNGVYDDNANPGTIQNFVTSVVPYKNGVLICGNFALQKEVGIIPGQASVAFWNGIEWSPFLLYMRNLYIAVYENDTHLYVAKNGDLLIWDGKQYSIDGSGATNYVSMVDSVVTVDNEFNIANSNLVVVGPCRLRRIENKTIGAVINVNIAVENDEILTIDLYGLSFTSSTKGIYDPGIDVGATGFRLAKGDNIISVLGTRLYRIYNEKNVYVKDLEFVNGLTSSNTDNYMLYFKFYDAVTSPYIEIYKDAGLTQLVATALYSSGTTGSVEGSPITAQNSSGIYGSLSIISNVGVGTNEYMQVQFYDDTNASAYLTWRETMYSLDEAVL